MPKGNPKAYSNDFDARSREGFSRLTTAVRDSWGELETMRNSRAEIKRQYVGKHYGKGGSKYEVPVNRMQQAIQVFTRQAVASNPRVLCTTIFEELKPTAFRFMHAMNRRIPDTGLRETLQDAFSDGLMSIGVVKVGLREGPALQFKNRTVRSTKVFAETVSPDDWVHDAMAAKWNQAQFFGDSYELPFEAVRRSNLYMRDVRARLTPSSSSRPFKARSRMTSEREFDRLEDMVRLCDIWLPQHGQIVTMVDPTEGGGIDQPLRVVDWDGPAKGPYHILSLQRVPDEILPLGPALSWMDLHEFQNTLFRKTAMQALNEKKVFAYRGESAKDAENIRASLDGDWIKVEHPDGVKDFGIGGASQTNTAMLMLVDQMFNKFSGNVDALAGLGPQSETLGQDRMIASSASAMVQEFQEKAVLFAKEVVRSIAFWVWNDPFIDDQFEIPLGDTGMTVASGFSADEREGEFPDYEIDIDLYSLQERAPSQRLQQILQVFQTLVFPMMSAGVLQQNGVTVNVTKLLETVFRYMNMEAEFKDLLKTVAPSMEPPRQNEEQGGRSPFQHRVTERVNRPGATNRQQSADMMNILLGNRVQDSEAAAIGRAAG